MRKSVKLTLATAKFTKVLNRTPSVEELALLAAIEVLVNKVPKKASVEKTPTQEVSPQFVHKRLRDDCSQLSLDTYTSGDFGRLGRTLGSITPKVTKADIANLADWINGGSLDFWTVSITWSHVVKHFVKWIAQSRAAECPSEAWLPSAIR